MHGVTIKKKTAFHGWATQWKKDLQIFLQEMQLPSSG